MARDEPGGKSAEELWVDALCRSDTYACGGVGAQRNGENFEDTEEKTEKSVENIEVELEKCCCLVL